MLGLGLMVMSSPQSGFDRDSWYVANLARCISAGNLSFFSGQKLAACSTMVLRLQLLRSCAADLERCKGREIDEPCGMLFLRYRKLYKLIMNGQRSLSIFRKLSARYIVHAGYFASSLIGDLNADETTLVLRCVKGSRYLNEVLTCLEW